MKHFAIDESNCVIGGNLTTWVVVNVNITSRKIRFEYQENRNTNAAKK